MTVKCCALIKQMSFVKQTQFCGLHAKDIVKIIVFWFYDYRITLFYKSKEEKTQMFFGIQKQTVGTRIHLNSLDSIEIH